MENTENGKRPCLKEKSFSCRACFLPDQSLRDCCAMPANAEFLERGKTIMRSGLEMGYTIIVSSAG
eukprot:3153302-Amphidinium_carterae.1